MTVSQIGSGRGAQGAAASEASPAIPPPTTPEEALVGVIAEGLERQQSAARQARRASQDAQRAAGVREVAAMHQSAEQSFYAGVARGVGTASSAIGKAVGGDEGTVGQVATGATQALQGHFEAAGKHADAAAAAARTDAQHHRQMAEEHGEDGGRAGRRHESAQGHLGQMLDARRQAEQAALRA